MLVQYEGWFLFCPIWANDEQQIAPKYRLEVVLWLATEMQQLFNYVAPWFVGDFEPGFYLQLKETEPFYLE